MTDKELLESAARAAGMIPREFIGNQNFMDGLLDGWNPLADDGDALRLAIYAGLRVSVFREHPSRGNPRVEVEYRDAVIGGLVFRFVCLAHGGVGFEEAARRAIVLTAAAIGEKVK